ncbi:MAG: nucleoside kinase [Clostridiaceae bacterium]|nr:nucleoside kinase [Clostridiaceae bacterium]
MSKLKLILSDNREIFVEKGKPIYEIIEENKLRGNIPIVLATINGEIHELYEKIDKEGNFNIIDTSKSIGVNVYTRSIQFVMIKAVKEVFPDAVVTIEHSINRGLIGEIHRECSLSIDDIPIIKEKMREIIEKNFIINKVCVTKAEAINIFQGYNMDDKVRFLKHLTDEYVMLYEIDGLYDYFYGHMAYSTGELKYFELNYYETGFLLRFPLESDPLKIPRFVGYKKLDKIYYETEKWGNIMGVGDVGSLNDKVVNGDIFNIIRVSEGFHEKKIANIADLVYEREKIKLVLIAGPSSSGKTTFSRRLGIQLTVNGLIPVPISLDDYFVNRELTPKDENGEYDFESIYSLDLELFNSNLQDLLEGKEVCIPNYNFKTGKREWTEDKIILPSNGVLIVEGIHGLNEILTSSIPKEQKFKIYISALTQLNIDNHNRIFTTDVRIIRRIVRDFLSRGYGAEDTLKMWASIRRGEEKNIFVFQEEADTMFNSTLVYELCILKKYALAELAKIDEDSPVYYEALRLKSFLGFFKDVNVEMVPENSLLREFVGGSCFYKY